MTYDVLIIGAGPGGIFLASILKKEGKKVALFEKAMIGGKVNIAPRVDNYPPYEKISGPDLAMEFFLKANEEKLEIIQENVTNIEKSDIFSVKTNLNTYFSKCVCVASGGEERKLGLDREDFFFGKGLSYCALCDGHFFKGKDVVVVGGGNSAVKEAMYLASLCKKVTVILRRDEFRAEPQYVEELKTYQNVCYLYSYNVTKLCGENHIEGIEITSNKTKEISFVKCDGFFPLIGSVPNTQFVHFDVLDEYKNIMINDKCETSVPGLFAIGDVTNRLLKQIIYAVEDAKIASKTILKYLDIH